MIRLDVDQLTKDLVSSVDESLRKGEDSKMPMETLSVQGALSMIITAFILEDNVSLMQMPLVMG